MSDPAAEPEWCVVATLMPYPYHPGPKEHLRSHNIYPAGAKLHVIGGFAGMGHEVVTVVGTAHRGRIATAHLSARLLGGWRTALIYRPAILRAIHKAVRDNPTACHRWNLQGFDLGSPDYAAYLGEIAHGFQEYIHGKPLP